MRNKKNTYWNRLFHKNEVKANVEQKQRAEKIISLAPEYTQKIGDITYKENDVDSVTITGATSLLDVLTIHKEAWSKGFQSDKIGPCSLGMFRCQSIENMNASEVFLGNIFGLNTQNIEFWEAYKNEGKSGGGFDIYNYLTIYQIILWQYKQHLVSNIRAIAAAAEVKLSELETLGY